MNRYYIETNYGVVEEVTHYSYGNSPAFRLVDILPLESYKGSGMIEPILFHGSRLIHISYIIQFWWEE